MEKEQNTNLPQDNNWLDDILGTSHTAKELGPDELAVQAAGLTQMDDTSADQIMDTEDLSLPLPVLDVTTEETIFYEASENSDIFTEDSFNDELSDGVIPEETEACDILSAPEQEELPAEEVLLSAASDEVLSQNIFSTEDDTQPLPLIHDLPDENETLDLSVQEDIPQELTAEETALEEGQEELTAEAILAEILAESKEEQAEPANEATVTFTPISQEPVPEAEEPPAAEEKKPTEEKPKERKVRPKMKKGYGLFGIPHVASTAIWLMLIVVIGLTIGNTLWVCITDLMAFGKPDRSITITITAEEVKTDAAGTKTVDIDVIAKKLKDAGLIQYPEVFKFFATNLTDKYLDIDAGTFTLNSKFDYNAMINNMIVREPPREEIDIMIPEGYTCAQIFALLEEKKVCTVAQLEVAAANGELGNYWFLEGVPRGNRYCLEGYLFPDTYRFYLNDDPVNVLKKFLDGFDYRFTNVMREKLETIKERTGLNIGIREVVIIASMIEKETASGAESYDISSVIYNRLNDPANYPYLNIDATIVYYLNGNIDPVTGLSKPLTESQLYTDHAYNTYTRRGLPAGPISNPGRNSLDAALDPNQDTGYHYYVFNPHSGVHIFAKSLYEHEQNINYVNSLG